MSRNADLFKSYLDTKDIKYSYFPAEEGRSEAVRVSFNGKNADSIRMNFFFDENTNYINIKCFTVAKVNKDKIMDMYVLLNELNNEYRWVKFYLDSDDEVTASGDAILDADTVGEECTEILIRYVGIIDEVYPRIMKVLWA